MKSFAFLLLFVATASHAQLAKNKCKFLGNVINNYTPADFAIYWNQVTPENAGKWGNVEATQDVMAWDQLDNAYNYAKANGFPFNQHAFVWGKEQPTWIGTLAAEEQIQQVEEWIMQFCERYPDTDYIEVVNEPLHETPVYAEAIGGAGDTGFDWVVWAFEKARQHCPKAKLLLNDYNIINNHGATDQYIVLIKILQDRGLIDYIGEQGHDLEQVTTSTLLDNIEKLEATGIPILITQYDVNIISDTGQKIRLETQFPVLWEHRAIHGITFWGYIQDEVSRRYSYLVRVTELEQMFGRERQGLEWLKGYMPNSEGGKFCLTGVDEIINDESFSVYPNPSDGEVTIETETPFVVFDMLGRMVLKGSGTASLRLLPGMYIVRSGGFSEKILIN